jgi:peptidoglycan/LPS O-acetylase OafA/YrhL
MTMLQTAAKVLGVVCLIVSVFHAIEAHEADAAAQQFRDPSTRAWSFIFVPLRWKPELYTERGQELVRSAWRHQKLLWLFGLLGGGFLLFGNASR